MVFIWVDEEWYLRAIIEVVVRWLERREEEKRNITIDEKWVICDDGTVDFPRYLSREDTLSIRYLRYCTAPSQPIYHYYCCTVPNLLPLFPIPLSSI